MNQKNIKNKKVLIGIIIGLIISPTIAIGSSFTISLIQRKTPIEAIQILASQIDFLISKTEQIEGEQIRLEACIKRDELLYPPAGWLKEHGGISGGTTKEQIEHHEWMLEERYKMTEEEIAKSTPWSVHTLEEIENAVYGLESRWEDYLYYKKICEEAE